MKVIIEPDRIKAFGLGDLGDARHCFVCLNGIGNTQQIEPPSLWNHQTKSQCHVPVLSQNDHEVLFCHSCSIQFTRYERYRTTDIHQKTEDTVVSPSTGRCMCCLLYTSPSPRD